MYDFIVVGKGLMGSAAFRYLTMHSKNSVLIGPDEPEDLSTHDGVFGAHYDQGRLTHLLGKDAVWGVLGDRSLPQYTEIEAKSGVHFYFPVGLIYVEDESIASTYFAEAENAGKQFPTIQLERPSAIERAEAFPYLSFPTTARTVWEKVPAGYINPRKMIEAQTCVGQAQGGDVIREMVVGVEDAGTHLIVTTKSGKQIQGRKLLVSAGSFSNGYGLLPRPVALTYKTEFVIFAEIPPAEQARLKGMPSLIYKLDSPVLVDIYMVPPVPYPDGKVYLKMGANTHKDRPLHTTEEICDWYRSGDSDVMMPAMRSAIEQIFPNIQVSSWYTHRCVPCYTTHRKPYIDTIQPGKIYISAGGNGSSAYCSDGIGQLAAQLVVQDRWTDTELDPAEFAVSFEVAK